MNGTEDKKPMSMKKKWALLVVMALVFGLIAGLTMYGVNAAANRMYDQNHISATDTAGDSDTDSTGNSGTSVEEVAKNAMPSLVTISTMSVEEMRSFFGGLRQYEVQGAGTGVIVGKNDTELLIATNNHVVEGATSLSVGFIDESSVSGEVKGTDAANDLAVVAVKLSDISDDTMKQIQIATVGDSDELQVGQSAIVIGNALGYGQSVSAGIISALNRQVQLQNSDGSIITSTLIQTDAAVNPGNSGGALVDMNGKVIGIVSAKYTDTDVEGMGYAIPISSAADIIQQMITQEVVDESESAYFGIAGADVTSDFAQQYGLPTGVYITQVEDGSAADKAGLSRGDVITSFNGRSVTSMNQIQNMMQYIKAGTDVKLTVAKASDNYEETDMTVTMGSRK